MRFGFPGRLFLRSICRYWHLLQWRCQGRFHRGNHAHRDLRGLCFLGLHSVGVPGSVIAPLFLGGFSLFSGHIVQHPLHGLAADFSQLTSTPTNEILFDRHIISPRNSALSVYGSVEIYRHNLTIAKTIISPGTVYRVEAWLSPSFGALLYLGSGQTRVKIAYIMTTVATTRTSPRRLPTVFAWSYAS